MFLLMYGVWITPNVALDIVICLPSLIDTFLFVFLQVCVSIFLKAWLHNQRYMCGVAKGGE